MASNTDVIQLDDVNFRLNESKILDRKIFQENVALNLDSYTIELFLNYKLIKTITTGSNQDTNGLIRNQTTNTGEFFFTILAADLVEFDPQQIVPAYFRFTEGAASPPNIFSNVQFDVIILRAVQE